MKSNSSTAGRAGKGKRGTKAATGNGLATSKGLPPSIRLWRKSGTCDVTTSQQFTSTFHNSFHIYAISIPSSCLLNQPIPSLWFPPRLPPLTSANFTLPFHILGFLSSSSLFHNHLPLASLSIHLTLGSLNHHNIFSTKPWQHVYTIPYLTPSGSTPICTA